MNVSDQIRSQITAADYAKCWGTDTPPPFTAFIDFTCNAFAKQLPAEISDLVVEISARADDRIGLGGSFISDSQLYKIFGDIVWLPKMEMFRGRPGFNKSFDAAPEAENDSQLEIEIRPLSELQSANHFETWTDFPSKPAIDESRRTLANTIDQLSKLENQSDTSKKIAALKQCIESFNQINERFDNFIDTDLREQIIDAVYEIALAGGLDPQICDSLDDWREW